MHKGMSEKQHKADLFQRFKSSSSQQGNIVKAQAFEELNLFPVFPPAMLYVL